MEYRVCEYKYLLEAVKRTPLSRDEVPHLTSGLTTSIWAH